MGDSRGWSPAGPPDGSAKKQLTTDGEPGGRLYSWLSASADGSRLAVVNASYAYNGRGRRLTGKLPRGGIGVIAEISPSGAQVATVDLLPEVSPAPVGSPPGSPGLSGFVPYMFVMNADGSAREATARSVIDIDWLGQRLVRTDRSDADPFPLGICVLAPNTDFECGSDAARDPTQDLFNPAFSSHGTLAAVVKSPSTTIGAGAIVIYDVATAAPVRELVGGENTQPTWSPDGKADRVRARRRRLRRARDRRAARAPRPEGRRAAQLDLCGGVQAAPPARPRAPPPRARHGLRAAARAPDRHAAARGPTRLTASSSGRPPTSAIPPTGPTPRRSMPSIVG